MAVSFDTDSIMQASIHSEHHAASLRSYFIAYAALLLFTALTVGVSFVNLGAWHTGVGLIIASIKATLVLVIFMHVVGGGPRTWLVVGASLFWLSILIGLTLNDYLTRPTYPP
jgi:cytochrome c oxidase subunit 4